MPSGRRRRAERSAWPLVLAALLLLVAESPALEPPSPEGVERAVQATFADPELAQGLETAHFGLQDVSGGLWSAVVRGWRRLQSFATELFRSSPLGYGALFAGMLLVLALLIAHIAWSVRQAFSRGDAGQPGEEEVEDAAARRRRSQELRAEARALAAEGRLREAARRLLLAFLALLAERRVLEVARSWTHREVLARLELPPAARRELEEFVRLADEACYADRAPAPEALARGEALLERLERQGAR